MDKMDVEDEMTWEDANTFCEESDKNIFGFCKCNCIDSTVLMTLCSHIMSLFHPMLAYGIYLVLPYYVIATPELGWSINDFSILFAAVAMGEIAGSQVVAISAAFNSDTLLFIGHMSQWIACFFGYIIMSCTIIPFNFWAFTVALFFLGYSYGMPAVQAYATEIADGDESVEIALMAAGGRLYIISLLSSSVIMPLLYDGGGWSFFCIIMSLCAAFCAFILVILIIQLKSRVLVLDETDEIAQQLELMQLQMLDDNVANNSSRVDSVKNSIANAYASAVDQDSENDKSSLVSSSEGDRVKIPLSAMMSPSMYVLLFVKFAFAVSSQMYYMAYPVIFANEFGINATTGGYLYATAGIFGFLALYFNQLASFKFSKWDYPYDITLLFGLKFIAALSYFVFRQSWVGYSLHWIFLGSAFAVSGVEMTSRLYLSPTIGFQRLTGLAGIIQAVSYVLGSFIGSPLMAINVFYPMGLIAILCLTTCILAMGVFLFRLRFFAGRFGSHSVSYLVQERVFYEKLRKSTKRRRAVVEMENISLLEDMEQQLNVLQKQFASRQGVGFLMNRNAGARLEAFANNAAVQEEVNLKLAQQLPAATTWRNVNSTIDKSDDTVDNGHGNEPERHNHESDETKDDKDDKDNEESIAQNQIKIAIEGDDAIKYVNTNHNEKGKEIKDKENEINRNVASQPRFRNSIIKMKESFRMAIGLDHSLTENMVTLESIGEGNDQAKQSKEMAEDPSKTRAIRVGRKSVLNGDFHSRQSHLFVNNVSRKVSTTRQIQSDLRRSIVAANANLQLPVAQTARMSLAKKSMARQMLPAIKIANGDQEAFAEVTRRSQAIFKRK